MSRFMSPQEATFALKKAGEFHAGKIKLPPEILTLKKQIWQKTQNAELFTAKLRVIDKGMINEIVELKLQLDRMYAQWAIS